jgi:predicted small metal-binding protein
MGKALACKDVGVDCDFVIHGKDEADVLRQAAEHAKGCHHNVQMTPEVQAKIRAAIKEDHGSSSCCGGSSCH